MENLSLQKSSEQLEMAVKSKEKDESGDELVNSGTEAENVQNKPAKEDKNSGFTLYKRRWIVLAVFSIVSMTNEVIWISLSSITSIVQVYYNVSYIAVNWLSMIYMLFYVFVVPTSYILNKYGLKMTIVIGTALNAWGSCFRCIGAKRNGFAFAFIGNTSAALAQCFILFIPPRLAAVWFGEHERATASAIGVLMNMLGVAVGFLMGGTMVPSSKDMDGVVREGMFNMLVSQAVFCSMLVLAVVLLIKAHPPSPPSMSQALLWKLGDKKQMSKVPQNKSEALHAHSESKESDVKKTVDESCETNASSQKQADGKNSMISNQPNAPTFLQSFHILVKDKSFHLVTQAYGFYFGLFAAYNTILNQMVTPKYPGKEREIGLMGFAAVICGLFAIFFGGIWLDRTRKYKALSVATFSACTLSMLAFTLLLTYHNNFTLLFVSFCIFGFFSYPYMSAGLEHAAEITYPVPEGTSSGILLLIGNMYGIILTYIVGAIIEKGGSDVGGYILAGSYAMGLIMVIFINAPLKRTNADHFRQT